MDPDTIDDALLPMLPPAWLDAIHAWAPTVLAALVFTTLLARLLLPLARRIEAYARASARTWDDAPARRLVEVLAWLAELASALLAWMPRIAMGPASSTATSRPRGPTAPPPLAVLALLVAVLATGCGGPPREVRVGLEQTAVGLDLADQRLAERIARRGAEARAQIRLEVAGGTIRGETPEATVDLGLARFEELLDPETLARAALRTAGLGALSVERVIDAWAAGARTQADFLGAAACAMASLLAVGDALTAAGVELPNELTDAVAFLAPLARGACDSTVPATATAGGAS
jgi:hypothetical protein